MTRPDGYLLRGRVTVEEVVAEVARGFDVTVADIMGPDQHRHIWMARACAMAVLRQWTGLSYPVIGKRLGRDHTTVMNNVSRVRGDPELSEAVRLVIEELTPQPQLFAVEHREAI